VNAIQAAVRVHVDLLVRRDYSTIERMTRGRRLSATDLERAVSEYRRKLVNPDGGWWESVEVTPIRSADQSSAYHVAVPLWTQEEGRSDLTLELQLTEIEPEIYESEVLDLHVL
jgi:hypothetical protein